MLNGNIKHTEIKIKEPSIDMRKTLKLIVSNWWFFCLSLIISVLIAFLVNRYAEPIYSANALILKESEGNSSDVQDILYGKDIFGSNSNDVINEIALLESYDLIEATLKDLALSISYYDEGAIRNDELYNHSPIYIAIDTSQSSYIPYDILFDCKILDTSQYVLSRTSLSLKEKLVNYLKNETEPQLDFLNKKFKFGKIYRYNGIRFSIFLIKDNYRFFEDNNVLFKINRYSDILKTYRDVISVEPYSEEADILSISIQGTHSQKTLDYLNKHIDIFLKSELNNKNQNAGKTIDFINHQILAMSDSLNLIESQLETLKKGNTSLNIKDQSGIILENSRMLEDDRNLILLMNEYLSNLQTYLANDQLDKIFVPSTLGITDESLNRSIQQLVNLRMEIQIMESDKSLSNPLIRIKKQQIDALKTNIQQIVSGLKQTNDLRLNTINNSLQSNVSSIQSIPTAERKLDNIERMHQLSENMYLFLMQKKAEAGIARASNSANYRVIDRAKYASIISPNKTTNYIAAIILGLLIPGVVLFIKQQFLDNKVVTQDDLKSNTSIPIIGTVVNEDKKRKDKSNDELDPFIAESFRMIRSNIRYLTKDDGSCQKFLITSSISGEGKSYVSEKLALFFSNFGKKVLFISLDMRKNENYEFLKSDAKSGLSTYLSNKAEINEIILNTKFRNLDIISSGGIPPNPTELLINGKIKFLFDYVCKKYDYVIIDSPPVGIIADAKEIMTYTDLNIYVARSRYTLKDHIKDLNSMYQSGYYKSMVLLLNGVDENQVNYNYNSYYRAKQPKAKTTI